MEKPIRIIAVILVVYAGLVASHEGEFWPFSIYPMFSQAGRPWTRAIVRDISGIDDPRTLNRTPIRIDSLPGESVPLDRYGIKQNDLANFVSKTAEWTPGRLSSLRGMFSVPDLESRRLLVMKVRGALETSGSVSVHLTPFIMITPDSTWVLSAPAGAERR